MGRPMTSLVVNYPQLDPLTYDVQTGQENYRSEPSSPLSVESPTPSALYHQPTILDQDSYEHEPSMVFDTSSQPSPITSNPAELEISSAALLPRSPITESQQYTFTHRHRESHKSTSVNKPRPYPRRREKAHKCPVRQKISSLLT